MDATVEPNVFNTTSRAKPSDVAPLPLRTCVQQAVERYFSHLDGHPIHDLYHMVLAEMEEPLLKTVLRMTKGNQSKAAEVLGLSRGTLRKKLEQYDLLQRISS